MLAHIEGFRIAQIFEARENSLKGNCIHHQCLEYGNLRGVYSIVLSHVDRSITSITSIIICSGQVWPECKEVEKQELTKKTTIFYQFATIKKLYVSTRTSNF